jgi:hypothetical protein
MLAHEPIRIKFFATDLNCTRKARNFGPIRLWEHLKVQRSEDPTGLRKGEVWSVELNGEVFRENERYWRRRDQWEAGAGDFTCRRSVKVFAAFLSFASRSSSVKTRSSSPSAFATLIPVSTSRISCSRAFL